MHNTTSKSVNISNIMASYADKLQQIANARVIAQMMGTNTDTIDTAYKNAVTERNKALLRC